MAVQGQGKDISCPQCFEINPAGSTFCSLCGAPLGEKGEAVEGSDTEVYRELAQTNLLRMRGEYKDAAQVCLSILKRYPHNITAHALLGDIYAEQGDLEQAAEWYEMALDLSPQAEAERQKLAAIRTKISEREQAATDVQLELPPEKPQKTGLMIGLMAAGILVIGAGAYFAGTAMRGNQAATANEETPVVINSNAGPGTTSGQDEPPVSTEPKSTDDAILALLKQSGRERSRYLSVVEDSRGPSLFVTVTATAEEDVHGVAVMVAEDVFATLAKYVSVTTRIMLNGEQALLADATRVRLEEVRSGLGSEDALAAHWDKILTDIRAAGEETVNPTTGSANPGETGQTPPPEETGGGVGKSTSPVPTQTTVN